MRALLHIFRRFFLSFLLFTIWLPSTVSGQLISLKTVPVATGDQFLIFPSQNLGMGGVSIALKDTLYDLFVNPAMGTRIEGITLFSSPMFYRMLGENGSARTLPLGILFGSERWFGGLSFSIQQMDLTGSRRSQQLLREKSSQNMYAFGSLGRRLSGSNTAVAASLFWANLAAVDGVEFLYPHNREIDQHGNMADFRMGFFHQWQGDRVFEALVLYHRFSMVHDVVYDDWLWDAFTVPSSIRTDVETNQDRSATWGIHLGYVQPFLRSDWCIGTILTANWKSHPKIPNYKLMNIPRDPGNSAAYNIGLGFSKSQEQSTFGIDFVYEPVWSNTWADAVEPVEARDGRMIHVGEKTVENDFTFTNTLVRIGLTQEDASRGFQMGLQLKSIRYRLNQCDYIAASRRKQNEWWMEWTVSLGVILKFRDFRIHYVGRVTMGAGQPGVVGSSIQTRDASFSDFIVAPSGPLSLQNVYVLTHQVTVSLPL